MGTLFGGLVSTKDAIDVISGTQFMTALDFAKEPQRRQRFPATDVRSKEKLRS